MNYAHPADDIDTSAASVYLDNNIIYTIKIIFILCVEIPIPKSHITYFTVLNYRYKIIMLR